MGDGQAGSHVTKSVQAEAVDVLQSDTDVHHHATQKDEVVDLRG